MRHAIRASVGLLGAVALVGAWGVAVGAASDGMLTKKDVGLPVLSAPHSATIFVYDDVVPGTCEQADEIERDGTVASFGTKTGPVLNEVVFQFGSTQEAAQFFADARAADEDRAECGTTANATIAGITSDPKGVGDGRYTVTSTEDVGGTTRDAVAITTLAGDRVVAINFLDWTTKQPPTKKIVKRALARLA